jgi:hypothetical protein
VPTIGQLLQLPLGELVGDEKTHLVRTN